MNIFVCDYESELILPGLALPPPVCLAILRPSTGTDAYVLNAEDGTAELEQALDAHDLIINHELAFDFGVAAAFRPHLIPKIFDAYDRGLARCTKVRQMLLDIEEGNAIKSEDSEQVVFRVKNGETYRSGYRLSDLEFCHLGNDRSKEKVGDVWRLKYGTLKHLPVSSYPEEAIEYPKRDVRGAWGVYQKQGPEVVNELEQNRAAWCMKLASAWGMRTNAERTSKLLAWADSEYGRIQQKLLEENLFRVEKASKAQREEGKVDFWRDEVVARGPEKGSVQKVACRYVKNTDVIRERVEAAFKKLGRSAPRTENTERNPSGQTKMDAFTFEQTDDVLLKELGDNGPIGTIRNTFGPTLKRGTEVPINSRYRELVASGRISSSDPNLNNIPREGGVRECFEAREGFLLCSNDLDCAELRSHAQVNWWLFKHSDAKTFFNANPTGDPYLNLVAGILGVPYADVVARKKAGEPEILGMRKMAKPIILGLPGGMGVDKIIYTAQKDYGVTLFKGRNPNCPECGDNKRGMCTSCQRTDAVRLKQHWLNTLREMQRYFEYISRTVGLGGASIMQLRPPVDGKHPPHRKRGNLDYCAACNTYFQGLTSDAWKHALWNVSWECYVDKGTALFGSRVVGLFYDELLVEVPEDIAHEAAFRLRDVMNASVQEWMPDVPITSTPALMKSWTKVAEAVYQDGRLVPWTPPATA